MPGSKHVTASSLEAALGCASALEDEARCRAMREQSALTIHDPSFGRADATATVQDFSLGPDFASLGRDRTHQGNLELEGGLANVFVEGRLNGQAHAAVE